MTEIDQFVSVDFHRFKAFEKFTFRIRHFNILVGPNNAGKSTILTAFRILAAALRTASARKPTVVQGPSGHVLGYQVDLSAMSVAEENIFYNYNDDEAAHITFTLSNKNQLFLYFPEQGACYLLARTDSGRVIQSPSAFRSQFRCQVGFVPILGPVEHNEPLYQSEAAQRALFSYQAARNFRNIWYHYPERFDEFRDVLCRTWPGMDIERPIVERSYEKPRLHMFCPEGRMPREIFWAGFGFQVWCQMLTHLIQSAEKTLFLIDEPDIYLHSDLQRQLLGLLRNLGPDIIIATHSTEIIAEAEPDDIVLVNKRQARAKRISQPSQLASVFSALGSNLNPILTQLAKTRRVVFVEGTDFQILGRFADKCGFGRVGNRSDFAVIPVGGFNPERVKSLRDGMQYTLGSKISAAAIFDRDYRSAEEAAAIETQCRRFCDFADVIECKEIENFLLVPTAIDRAATNKLRDRNKRAGSNIAYSACAAESLDRVAKEMKIHVMGQYISKRRNFERRNSQRFDDATIGELALHEFEMRWNDAQSYLTMIPGKEALSAVNKQLQEVYGISVTPAAIIDAMTREEVPPEMQTLVRAIADFISVEVKE